MTFSSYVQNKLLVCLNKSQ